MLVVSTKDGTHIGLRSSSGEVIFKEEIEELPGGAIDGVLESDMLILVGLEETTGGYRWKLTGIEGHQSSNWGVRWSYEFTGALQGPQLRLSKGVIPFVSALQKAPVANGNSKALRAGSFSGQQVGLINKNTGALIVQHPITELANGRFTGEMALREGRLFLQATNSIIALQTIPADGRQAAPSTPNGVN